MDGLSKPMSKLGQLMMLRAIGVAIVLEGTMLPTMELLLRHAIQYFNLKGSALLRDPDSKLDDLEQFLADLPNLDKEEQVTTQAIYTITSFLGLALTACLCSQNAVLCVMLLTEMFDGDLDPEEFEVWERISMLLWDHSDKQEPHVPVDQYALQQVARDFRQREFITAGTLRAAIAPGAKGRKERELWHKTTQFLLT